VFPVPTLDTGGERWIHPRPARTWGFSHPGEVNVPLFHLFLYLRVLIILSRTVTLPPV